MGKKKSRTEKSPEDLIRRCQKLWSIPRFWTGYSEGDYLVIQGNLGTGNGTVFINRNNADYYVFFTPDEIDHRFQMDALEKYLLDEGIHFFKGIKSAIAHLSKSLWDSPQFVFLTDRE